MTDETNKKPRKLIIPNGTKSFENINTKDSP